MKNLGFGMMRLPVIGGDPTNFNYEELNKMVDAFLEAGYNYFDTSYVYHNGKSEEATRKALIERHPRESFRVATKFPSFIPMSEEDVEKTFAQQLENLGVDYIDYYLLHNLQTVWYDGIEGKGDGLFSQSISSITLRAGRNRVRLSTSESRSIHHRRCSTEFWTHTRRSSSYRSRSTLSTGTATW